jgi:hypothetical protein
MEATGYQSVAAQTEFTHAFVGANHDHSVQGAVLFVGKKAHSQRFAT